MRISHVDSVVFRDGAIGTLLPPTVERFAAGNCYDRAHTFRVPADWVHEAHACNEAALSNGGRILSVEAAWVNTMCCFIWLATIPSLRTWSMVSS